MEIGLALPHYDFSFPDHGPATVARAVTYATEAERLGYGSVWVSDHLFLDLTKYGGPADRFASVDPFVTLSAVAAATATVRFGTLVACVPFRAPLLTANMARSLDDLSGGRFELGLGAGWYEPEFADLGIRFAPVGERMGALEAATRAIRDDLRSTSARVEVFVGGKGGPRVMRLVAEAADGWNIVWRTTPADYRALVERLHRACEAAGRDPASLRLSVGLSALIGSDERDLAARFEALRRWTPGEALAQESLDSWRADRLVGTPEVCAGIVKELEAAGASRVIVSPASLPFSIFQDEQVEMIARDLIPMVR